MTISERVEAALFGNVLHRDGDFESVAAEILGMTQREVDEELVREQMQKESQ